MTAPKSTTGLCWDNREHDEDEQAKSVSTTAVLDSTDLRRVSGKASSSLGPASGTDMRTSS